MGKMVLSFLAVEHPRGVSKPVGTSPTQEGGRSIQPAAFFQPLTPSCRGQFLIPFQGGGRADSKGSRILCLWRQIIFSKEKMVKEGRKMGCLDLIHFGRQNLLRK